MINLNSYLFFVQEDALQIAADCIETSPHARVYLTIALLDAGYGVRAARRELDAYMTLLQKNDLDELSPLLLFALYLIGKEENIPQKSAKFKMADALSSFRCYSNMATQWLTPDDTIDQLLAEENLEDGDDEESDEDEVDLTPDPSPTDPEVQWAVAKENHGVVSPSMDKLMQLTGMHEVKARAVNVCKEVLLSKKRPANIKAQVAMNFLFGAHNLFAMCPFANNYLINFCCFRCFIQLVIQAPARQPSPNSWLLPWSN